MVICYEKDTDIESNSDYYDGAEYSKNWYLTAATDDDLISGSEKDDSMMCCCSKCCFKCGTCQGCCQREEYSATTTVECFLCF
ncbi:unnamed protein product [Anisakis simplex]|uniref:Ovule protein n=1 Tax=Anisakis simplex TaxID=6269 RepID=A0A0M3JAX6_ANISI|nr:unnamed protein product [Anisakis simplex]